MLDFRVCTLNTRLSPFFTRWRLTIPHHPCAGLLLGIKIYWVPSMVKISRSLTHTCYQSVHHTCGAHLWLSWHSHSPGTTSCDLALDPFLTLIGTISSFYPSHWCFFFLSDFHWWFWSHANWLSFSNEVAIKRVFRSGHILIYQQRGSHRYPTSSPPHKVSRKKSQVKIFIKYTRS